MKSKQKHMVEWDLLLKFGLALVLWMFIILPYLNQITSSHGTIVSYGIYLLGWLILGYYIGDVFDKGIESGVIALNLMWTTDVIAPPIIIDYATAPTQAILNIWGSDTFTYSLWSILHLPHQITWILTYVATPLLGLFVLLYLLSGNKLKKTLRNGLGC